MANDLINKISVRMQYLSERQAVLASNVANANTPGYKAKDLVEFSSLVDDTSGVVKMTKTHAGHIDGSSNHGGNFALQQQDYSSDTTPTGNNVVLEEQMLKMNEAAFDYKATTSLYRKINSLMKTAIGDDR